MEDRDRRANERRSRRHDSNPIEDHDRRGEDQDTRATKRRSRRHYFESNLREDDRKEEERNRNLLREGSRSLNLSQIQEMIMMIGGKKRDQESMNWN